MHLCSDVLEVSRKIIMRVNHLIWKLSPKSVSVTSTIVEITANVLSMKDLLLCGPLCKRCTSVQGQVLTNRRDKLTS